MAISAINITKFSAARIEGNFTSDATGDCNVRLKKAAGTGSPARAGRVPPAL